MSASSHKICLGLINCIPTVCRPRLCLTPSILHSLNDVTLCGRAMTSSPDFRFAAWESYLDDEVARHFDSVEKYSFVFFFFSLHFISPLVSCLLLNPEFFPLPLSPPRSSTSRRLLLLNSICISLSESKLSVCYGRKEN